MKNEPPTSERKTENDNKLVSPQLAKGSLEQETNDQSNQNGMSPSKIEEKVLNEKDYKNCDNKEDVNNHKDEMSKKMELKTADNKDENIVKDELKSNSKSIRIIMKIMILLPSLKIVRKLRIQKKLQPKCSQMSNKVMTIIIVVILRVQVKLI